jgi:hypothetical protein
MKSLLDHKYLFTAALILVLAGLFAVAMQSPNEALGSVTVGDQYQSTTTNAVADRTNLCPARVGMASSTTGVLGSVNVLLTGAGTISIYDATTTIVTARSADQSTTSIRLADFPASATAGSYHFDIAFKRGLLVDYGDTGTVASTTISYRCEG